MLSKSFLQRWVTTLAAMIFGTLGVAANILIYQMKSGKKILLSKLISDFSGFFTMSA